MFKLTILLISVASSFGQSVQNGLCLPASKTVVQNFNETLFAGQWYQIERIPNADDLGECFTSTFVVISNVTMSVVDRSVENGVVRQRTGALLRAPTATEARWTVNYAAQARPYLVLATDYTNYAFVYSCADITNNTHQEFAWKLSRANSLTASQAAAINSTVALYPTLVTAPWRPTSHSNQACNVGGTPGGPQTPGRSSSGPSVSGFLVLVAVFLGFKLY